MIKKQLSLIALMVTFFTFSQGNPDQSTLNTSNIVQDNSQQLNYVRISINNFSDFVAEKLHNIGIDMTCGAVQTGNQMLLEVREDDLQILTDEGISYTVLIEDMQKFYSERAVNDLPMAKLKLEQAKAQSANKSYSINEILNNVGQYDGCDEIDWAVPANWNLNPNSSPNSFGGCLTYSQVLQELDDMRSLYPNLISTRLDASPTNQTTFEGRTVWYVRISDNPDIDESGEPETLYQSLIHSREAVSVMQLLYYMWYILENYNSDAAIQNLVNNQALYFIPVFNPDGFVYNETVAPDGGGGQRKNRNTSASGSCSTYLEGIDLNRNSAYYWGNGGSSTNSCSDTYLGTAPFSEAETQIMRDFFLQHDFKLALNHHSFKNAMLHAYAGTTITNPRPDEYSKYNHDMTYYNRYAHGPSTSISSLNSGNMNDWMLGGPAGVSANGTPTGTGSGKNTMAWTPENGLSSEGTGGSYGGFWPQPSNYLPISQRMMRGNFMAAYFSGKYGKLHDLNQSDLSALSGNLTFGIERLGQTDSDFTLTVTPVSSNILSLGGPTTQTGMAVLQQNNVNISYTLDPAIQPNDEIEFKVVLTNDYASGNVLYEANIKKAYNPTVLFADNPDTDNLSNWTTSGGTWSTTGDAFTGTTAITSTLSAPYSNNEAKQLQLNSVIDMTGMSSALIQFFAKWDLERSFDYVQLEGSTDGTNWTPLCGKLTKPGAPNANNTYSGKSSTNNNFQPDGQDLYDGDTQDKWNMEEVVIDATTNSFLYNQSTVYLRFDFRTDGSNREDSYVNVDFEGFTFDNFKVISNGLIPDTEAPTAPSNLTAANVTETTLDLNWTASTDNIGVSSYDVYQDAVVIGNTPSTSFAVTGLTENTTYDFYVIAKDAAGNESAASNTVNVTTLTAPTCDDGIQNGDETGVDCGGSNCAPCPTVTLNEGYFETGLDGWIDGGNDCARVQSGNSFEGAFSIRIRDNSGTSSSMTSPTFDLTDYEKIDVSFYYYAVSMENNEDFWLQFNNGSGWVTVSTYVSGQDFSNGSFNFAAESITDAAFTFTPNSRIRIVCDASGNNDQVFVDQVITIGTLAVPPDTQAPTAPANLTATNTTEFTTDLSWDPSTDNVGVTGYDVYQDGVNIGNSATTTFAVTGLNPSTTYSFYVIARDAAGNSSAQSNTINVTTQDFIDTDPPTAPTGLSASNTTDTSTDLSWNASTDNVGVTGYDVYQDGVNIGNSVTTSFAVTGLSPSTSYNFYVIARDAAGNSSGQSNTVNVTTNDPPDTEAPTAPTNLTASNTTEFTTDLSWTASTDNVGVTGYDVYQDGVNIDNTSSTTYNVTGLNPSTTYSFYVIARDAAGNSSGLSNTVNVTTNDDTEAPTAPTGLAASNTTETTTDLSWNASTDNVGVTGYDVYQDGVNIGNSVSTSFAVTGLSPSTSYNFYVIARDAAGNSSGQSNTVNVTTNDPPDTEAPTAPTNLAASNTTEFTTDLSWTASTDNVGVTGYDVYQDGVNIDNTSSTTYNVTGLNPSTTYSFYVIARDAAGNSSGQSNTVNVTTNDDTEAPTAPTGLAASNTTDTTTDLSWNASTDNVGVTDYDVFQDGLVVANVTGTSYQVTGLTESTTYSFYVVANDAAGNSSGQSNTVNVTTEAASSEVIINQGFFETGLDGWTDGGNDCARVQSGNSFEGAFSIRLRDNTGSSVMTLSNVDVTPYSQIEVQFYYYPNSMENGEDFWLQYFNGSSYQTVATYTSGTDFSNGSFFTDTVIIDSAIYNFVSNAGFRFRCDASANNDQVFIDQVTIKGFIGSPQTQVESGGNETVVESNSFDKPNTEKIRLYPNPVNTLLNINTKGQSFDSYEIYNKFNQLVLKGAFIEEIDVSRLDSGVYFIRLYGSLGISVEQFIKK